MAENRDVQVQDHKTVWVAWTNTDRTEGKGREIPCCVAATKETAERLGHARGVMGSDCDVTPELAVKIGNRWLVPGVIEQETESDKRLRLRRESRDAAVARAKAAGLSVEDIKAIAGW